MTIQRPFAFALMGLLAVTAVAPVWAQNNTPKPSKQEKKAMPKSEMQTRKAERKMEKKEAKMENNMMAGDHMMNNNMAPSMMNNTAAVQGNIDRANKTLSDMVALLDQIEARKRGGGAQ